MNRFLTLFLATSCLTAVGQVPGYVPTDGLVGWWPLDGNAVDVGPNQLEGQLVGSTFYEGHLGDEGGSLWFQEGAFVRSSIPDLSAEQGVTYTAWVQRAESPGIGYIVGYGNSTQLGQSFCLAEGDSYGLFATAIGSPYDALSNQPLTPNEWVFVATTILNDEVMIYKDGQVVFDGTIEQPSFQSDGDMWIGVSPFNQGQAEFWEGAIDEVGVWSRVLSVEEIDSLFNELPRIQGCTNPEACNFDSSAQEEDGSCILAPVVDLGGVIESCGDSVVVLDAGESASAYLWSTGETTSSILIEESGEYTVSLSNSGGMVASEFDGSGDYITLTPDAAFALPGDFSFEVWVNIPSGNEVVGWNTVLGGYDEYRINIYAGSQSGQPGVVRVECPGRGPYVIGMTDLRDDDWHHIAVVQEGTLMRIFVDGVVDASGTLTGQAVLPETFTKPLYFGKANHTVNEDFRGKMADARLWSIALSQEEVIEFMQCPPQTSAEGLVGFWKMSEEVDNAFFVDHSPNGNDGAIAEATLLDEDINRQLGCCFSSASVEVIINSSGCMDSQACNYDSAANCDDGSCDYSCCPGPGCCTQGMFWDWELSGCYNINPADINLDGCVQLNDLLDLLSAYGDCGAEEAPWACGDPLEYQGYDYATVQIGEQCWFAENLRAENDRDGGAIESIVDDGEWTSTASGAWCSPGPEHRAVFGLLYNGHAALMETGLCPSGWDVPSKEEWQSLSSLAGGEAVAGLALKSSSGWPIDSNGNDALGFTGLPAGTRNHDTGLFAEVGTHAYFHSSTSSGSEQAWRQKLFPDANNLGGSNRNLNHGFSVRCLKDAE